VKDEETFLDVSPISIVKTSVPKIYSNLATNYAEKISLINAIW